MPSERLDLPQGTLELLILRALTRGSLHGYALARWIEGRSEGRILVEEGSLYPAVHRMEKRGLIQAEWGKTDSGRRARFYTLTTAGKTELATRKRRWSRLVDAVGSVLSPRARGKAGDVGGTA